MGDNMGHNYIKGRTGESIAAEYIRKCMNGRIMATNIRIAGVEVDILAVIGVELFIVEVKLSSRETFYPEQNVSKTKMARLHKARNFLDQGFVLRGTFEGLGQSTELCFMNNRVLLYRANQRISEYSFYVESISILLICIESKFGKYLLRKYRLFEG